jgi:deoxyribonuclease V
MVSHESAIPDRARYVAGVDISPPDEDGIVRSAVVVLEYPGLEVREVRLAEAKPNIPYIPGLLSFRETPALIDALESLELTPDIIIVDGQGIAHPRRFGIACHLGLLADTPTIGCAKSILRGRHGPLDTEAGSQAEMIDRGDLVGLALRTRKDVSPVYVSVGHKVSLPLAAQWVLACCKGRRLPETTRLAHQAAAGRLAPGLREASTPPVNHSDQTTIGPANKVGPL